MRWAEITIRTTEEASEAISEMLAQAGCDGIAVTDPFEFRNTVENDPLSYADDGIYNSYGTDVVIKSYFAELDDGYVRMGAKNEEFFNPDGIGTIYGNISGKTMKTEDAVEFIKARIDDIGKYLPVGKGFEGLQYVKDEDWANNWKKYYREFKISDRVAICPSWLDPDSIEAEHKIILDPGSAFGTGTHETTSMCAKLIDKYMNKDATVLDLGTGSGILAIIAKKLGSGTTEAIDIDKLAVDVAIDNCRTNGCDDIDCHTGELKDAKRNDYDLIVANIIADIIAELAEDIPSRLGKDGLFICSGIINTKKEKVEKAISDAGMTNIESRTDNDWMAYVCQIK